MRLVIDVELPGSPVVCRDLVGATVSIGRSPDSDLHFSDQDSDCVSWQHAKLTTSGNGNGITLLDLNSTNGTFLNGRPIHGATVVKPGDVIRLGTTGPKLTIRSAVAESAATPDRRNPPAPSRPDPPPAAPSPAAPSRPSPFGYAAQFDVPSAGRAALGSTSPAADLPVAGAPQLDSSVPIAASSWEPASVEPQSDSTRELVTRVGRRMNAALVATVFVSIGLLLAIAFLLFVFPGYLLPGYGEKQSRRLVARIQRSVVKIQLPNGVGSGFILDDLGTVVTNFHVVVGSDQAIVVLDDGREVPVEGFVAYSAGKDLALLRINASGDLPPPLPLANGLPETGDNVFVFGSPKGYRRSVSSGIVSNILRGSEVAAQMQVQLQTPKGNISVNVYRDVFGKDEDAMWVQTSAPVLQGNSGGPLVNLHGEVLGVNTFGPNETLNFASAAVNIRHVQETMGSEVRPLSELPDK